MKPDCRLCIHHREIPGNTHVSCKHPATKALFWDSPFAEMIVLCPDPVLTPVMVEAARSFGGHLIVGQPNEDEGIEIRFHPHAVIKGWFAWPFNLDPVWLKFCTGFEGKDA